MCLSPVRPAVRRVGTATCITLSPLITSSLPGNLVAWQHERGSPRGDFSRVRGEGKQKGRRKGRSPTPTGASHLSPLCLGGARRHRPASALAVSSPRWTWTVFGFSRGRQRAVTPRERSRSGLGVRAIVAAMLAAIALNLAPVAAYARRPLSPCMCMCTGDSVIQCEMCLHFLSCYTVELQLPSDACSLPGNQDSISPSTSSPHTHTHTHSRTRYPSLTSQRLRFWRRLKSLLTAGAVVPSPFGC